MLSLMSMIIPRVTVVIMNWNGWKNTIECLESLFQIEYPNYEVIVTDNASTDDSIQRIEDYCNGNVVVESKYVKYTTKNKPIQILKYLKQELDNGQYSERESSFHQIQSNRKLMLILNDKDYKFSAGVNVPLKYVKKLLKTNYIFS